MEQENTLSSPNCLGQVTSLQVHLWVLNRSHKSGWLEIYMVMVLLWLSLLTKEQQHPPPPIGLQSNPDF